MNLIVDSNVLFTFFWKNSVSRKLFTDQELELHSPAFALEEIKTHTNEIMSKTKLTREQFESIKKQLSTLVNFINLETYATFLKEACTITPDQNDVDFIALSLKLKCPIWSNDHALTQQDKCRIFTTKEIIELISEKDRIQ